MISRNPQPGEWWTIRRSERPGLTYVRIVGQAHYDYTENTYEVKYPTGETDTINTRLINTICTNAQLEALQVLYPHLFESGQPDGTFHCQQMFPDGHVVDLDQDMEMAFGEGPVVGRLG